MCGICGVLRLDGGEADSSKAGLMAGLMRSRGPDDDGFFAEGSVALAHVRLSIIDLSEEGRQPMLSPDKNLVLVFNGEIYNYIELRKELEPFWAFRTNTDTEVLLAAFSKWGKACLDRLNGMFAFAIWDRKRKSLYAARDRYGVKPFYYSVRNGEFVFASTPAAVSAGIGHSSPDKQALYDYFLHNRTNHSARTFFEGVSRLPHGHELEAVNAAFKVSRWYDLRQRAQTGFSGPEEMLDSLRSSVRLRLRSDVPVGACLSGGLDSSAIVELMLAEKASGFHTFSAVYGEGRKGDESRYIRIFRDRGLEMHEARPTGESLANDLEKFISALGEPLPGTSGYAEFKVMESAKGRATVILNGQGADEEFAGYHYFFAYLFKELLLSFRLPSLAREMGACFTRHRSLYPFMAFAFMLAPGFLKESAAMARRNCLSKDFFAGFSASPEVSEGLYSAPCLRDALFNHFEHKLEHHLMWGDRNSMHFSLEQRFPFLDFRFVEKALALPGEAAIKNGVTKTMLRESLRGVLPEALRMRMDKVGFETPEAEWFRALPLSKIIREILESSSFQGRGIFDRKKAIAILEAHESGRSDCSSAIWKAICVELWMRIHIDRPPKRPDNDRPLNRIGV